MRKKKKTKKENINKLLNDDLKEMLSENYKKRLRTQQLWKKVRTVYLMTGFVKRMSISV